jgi:hypothetical protein
MSLQAGKLIPLVIKSFFSFSFWMNELKFSHVKTKSVHLTFSTENANESSLNPRRKKKTKIVEIKKTLSLSS